MRVTVTGAASLVVAILQRPREGSRTYLPAARENVLELPAADVIREHYAGVPLKRPVEEIESLVDTSQMTEETGWRPAPPPSGVSGEHIQPECP